MAFLSVTQPFVLTDILKLTTDVVSEEKCSPRKGLILIVCSWFTSRVPKLEFWDLQMNA